MVVRGDWVTGEAWVGPASLKGRFQALALQLWGERNFTLEEWPVADAPARTGSSHGVVLPDLVQYVSILSANVVFLPSQYFGLGTGIFHAPSRWLIHFHLTARPIAPSAVDRIPAKFAGPRSASSTGVCPQG
ncbi:hypothetical protein ASPNIDRAFT_44938 [Aspergillus niger ATCC 1015]|uniref:Uncharacterized protein n=1 Tax=Aspergillus niger (strain ATCC 1015 / CBS 113.46 / FGSC A1144 / LSHB Ac4 / NCTC 3858a / NRRL 328 / USDA 3528.7) TaxID=380704 RepID=G3XQF2_ASPNA|nr:hypothetical protein ASPNIDRAFT_44938 [Aspergillus niger ATCC 1015]